MSDSTSHTSIRPLPALLRAAAVIGTVLVVFFARVQPHRFPATQIQLACAGLGALLLATVAHDLRRGSTFWPFGPALREFDRAGQALGFWLATAIFGAAGAVLVVGALGSLLGLWTFLR
jgi:hypothetical protein